MKKDKELLSKILEIIIESKKPTVLKVEKATAAKRARVGDAKEAITDLHGAHEAGEISTEKFRSHLRNMTMDTRLHPSIRKLASDAFEKHLLNSAPEVKPKKVSVKKK